LAAKRLKNQIAHEAHEAPIGARVGLYSGQLPCAFLQLTALVLESALNSLLPNTNLPPATDDRDSDDCEPQAKQAAGGGLGYGHDGELQIGETHVVSPV
jgi:hypothetical protein